MDRYLSKITPSTLSIDNGFSMGTGFSIREVKEISSMMAESTGIPYDHAPVSFLKRRLAYIYRKHNIRNTDIFKQMLETEEYKRLLLYDFPVDTTEMFRDPGFWRYLRSLLKCLNVDDRINVWFPDVSTGEEVFSFLILVNELGIRDKFSIICQHPSEQRLNEVKNGIMNKKNIKVNSGNYVRIEGTGVFEDYYASEDTVFTVHSSLLKNIHTVQGHFLNTGAPENVGIVMFRNIMLYYDKEVSEMCVEKLGNALLPGGIMAIGTKEQLPGPFVEKLECINSKEKIFRKHGFEIKWNNDR